MHDDEAVLIGYVASRAHHAEIGGTRPGSMPPAARTLAEEGVVIAPMHLVRGGEARWEAMRGVLAGGPHPSRAMDDNLADLAAAVAANHRGAEMLRALAREHGRDAVADYMDALKQRAEAGIRDALRRIPDGAYEAEERLDDGSPLRVRIAVDGDRATIDFAGSAEVHPGNLNATPAIVRSVVLYVLRLLVREPLPLNEGLLRAVELIVPPGLLNPPFGTDPALRPGGGRRQHGSEPAAYGYAAQGAGRRRLQPGDDEQRALGDRTASATTRRCAAGRARGRGGTGRARCTAT